MSANIAEPRTPPATARDSGVQNLSPQINSGRKPAMVVSVVPTIWRVQSTTVSRMAAASAALAMPVVNFVLIPEMDFSLEGEEGFLKVLEKRLQQKKHAVIVVAEGAGQQLFEHKKMVKDASGNVQHQDIGVFLKERITEYFKGKSPVTIKYIDPSYIVRCAPANSSDSVYCSRLAYYAVHGAMAGKTKCVVSKVNNKYVYVPIAEVTQKRKKIDMEGEFWFSVLQSTGQPFFLG